jgi:hypothetical protein
MTTTPKNLYSLNPSERAKYLNSLSEYNLLKAVAPSYSLWVFDNLKDLSDKVYIALIKEHPYYIQHIKSPNINIQLASVKLYPESIQYIKDPSEKVQLATISQENKGWSVRHIRNPTEKVQITAVKNLPYNFIKDFLILDKLIPRYITSPKALELYEKLKRVRNIIK